MQEQNNNNFIEDISSGYVNPNIHRENPVSTYSEGLFKHIGGIVKAIAFIIAFGIIAISFVVAYFLYTKEKLYMALSLGIVIGGTFIALINLFLIYGMGQILTQNNEIIKQLNRK